MEPGDVGDGCSSRELVVERWHLVSKCSVLGHATAGFLYSRPHLVHHSEPLIELSPALFLTTWAAGLAGVAAVVAWWRVVGPGFGWLSAAVTALLGGIGWGAGGGWAAAVGTGVAIVGGGLARRPRQSAAALAIGAVFFGAASVAEGTLLGTLSGAALLGGVTGEMLLGHWYLIDPTLPRWALRRLASFGAAGVIVDATVVAVDAGFDWGSDVVGWAFLVLALTTLVLMTAVWFALNEPSYPGVMAATGLSYLAILTAVGAAVAGRALVEEGSSLLVP